MSKSDLLKDSMKGGLDGLLSPTKKTTGGKQKFLAIKKNMSLKDIVNEAMKEYLEKNEQ